MSVLTRLLYGIYFHNKKIFIQGYTSYLLTCMIWSNLIVTWSITWYKNCIHILFKLSRVYVTKKSIKCKFHNKVINTFQYMFQICKPKIVVINTKYSSKFAINYLSNILYERNTKITHNKLSCTYTCM